MQLNYECYDPMEVLLGYKKWEDLRKGISLMDLTANDGECSDIDKWKQPDLCAICLEEMKHNMMTLNCSHKFHKKCINDLFREKHNCPQCSTTFINMYPNGPL